VDYRQQSALCWVRTLNVMMGFLMFLPTLGSAADFVIIGGSEQQKQLVSCIAEASTGLFRETTDPQQSMTCVILEHDKFLQSRAAFHAYRTKLAYSNLAIRRIYLSSRALADRDTALWGVGHELGHFMIRDGVEGHAEFAAERIRWRARQTCGSITQ
jgi:hypothetical protein